MKYKGRAVSTCELAPTGLVFLECRIQCHNIGKQVSHPDTTGFITHNFGNVDIFSTRIRNTIGFFLGIHVLKHDLFLLKHGVQINGTGSEVSFYF